MGRRPLLVMVLGWFAVVGAVGAITFVVVSNAGSGVGPASAAERVIVDSPTASETTTQTPTPTLTPSVTPSPSTIPTPTPKPTTTKTSRPSDDPAPRSTSTAPRTSAPPVDRHTASFSTDGGVVVAKCRESRISLVSIRLRDGWRYEKSVTRATLEVHFKAPERELEIYLRCVDEVPTRLKPGSHWGVGDRTSPESQTPRGVRPTEGVQSEGLEHATPSPSPALTTSPSTSSSTEETPHG